MYISNKYLLARYLFSVLFILNVFNLKAGIEWIYNQSQFDKAVKDINNGIAKDIQLSSGIFILKEKIKAKNYLSLTGHNSIITWNNDSYSKTDAIGETSTHYICKLKKSISPFSLFVDDFDRIVEVSSSVDPLALVNSTTLDILGENTKEIGISIKIPITDNLIFLRNKILSNSYGYFDCGWAKINFVILKSDNKYFYCKTLDVTSVKDFNYDKIKYKKEIRYVIFNAEIKKECVSFDEDRIFIPKNINRLICIDYSNYDKTDFSISSTSNIVLKDINFKNFNGISIKSKYDNVCLVKNCIFLNTLGCALYLSKENNSKVLQAHISDCKFYSCSLVTSYVVSLYSTYNNTKCIHFSNCIISRYPDNNVFYKNCLGTLNVKADAIISNNIVFNSPRCHIFLVKGDIIINGNTLFNSDTFNSNVKRNLSSDFGLIYCGNIFKEKQESIENTRHRVLIYENLIYGAHGYHKDARGIMIDDGRGDVICRNNVVFDTESYSLDSRDAKGFVSTSSIRNIFEGNIIGSKYRLASGSEVPDNDLAISDNNIMLGKYKNDKSRIKSKREDNIHLLQSSIYGLDGKAIVSKADYKKLKKLNNWKQVKKFFKSK